MSRDVFPADPGLPQLQITSNPTLMRELFQTHLRPLTRTSCRIQDCLLSRVRYRRGTGCILQYTLDLAEPGMERQRDLWVTGVIYAEDRAERIWRKLQSAPPTQKIPEAWLTFEPISFMRDLKMLVQVVPYDRRLPTLPGLMAGPSPDLEPLFLSGFGPGEWHAEGWTIEPIRYRAQLGAVLRYTVEARDLATGRNAKRRFYVKVYRDGRGERTYQLLQELCRRAEPGKQGFRVGRPITYLSGLHALLQEEADGVSLRELLLQGRDNVEAMRKVAWTLALFNQDNVAPPRRDRLADEVLSLKRTERLLKWACPHLGTEIEATVGAVAGGLEEVPPRPTHGDLKPDHIWLEGDRVVFIDLDSFVGADPVLDPAFFLARLAAMSSQFPLPDGWVRNARQSFVEEYFSHVPRAWRRQLPLHYAGAILEVAAGFFRRQEPCWSEKIGAFVAEASDSVAGRVW